MELEVVNASTIKPLDTACLDAVFASGRPIFTMEEHVLSGGFGSSVLEYACKPGKQPRVTIFAVGDIFVPHGDHAHLLAEVGLDDDTMMDAIQKALTEGEQDVR